MLAKTKNLTIQFRVMINKPPVNQPATCRLDHHEPHPQGIYYINANAGTPASACQTPEYAGVRPLNTNSDDHGRDY
jgi:hypothetical protein